MNFKIDHISIDNFRAIEKLETDLWDRTIVSGANESAKSTFASAITWALYGNDVENNSTFEIIPFGKYGEVSPTVILECKIDDRPITIARVYKAKKHRDNTFDCYETKSFVNGLEMGIRKFNEWISQNICSPKIFRIISNPKMFIENPPCEQKELTWQAQRKMLLDIIGGDTTDLDIVKSSNRWIDLVEPIERYSDATQYLKYLKTRYSEIQKELDTFAVKIEQQEKNRYKVKCTEKEANNAIAHAQNELNTLQQKNEAWKAQNRNENAIAIQEQIETLNQKKTSIIENYQTTFKEYEEKSSQQRAQASTIQAELNCDIETLKKYITALEKLQSRKIKTVCEYCGQKLNEQSTKKAENELKSRISNGEITIKNLKKEIEEKKRKIVYLLEASRKLMMPTYPAEIAKIDAEIAKLQSSIATYDLVENMENYDSDFFEINKRIAEYDSELKMIEQNKRTNELIQAIEEEQTETAKTLSELQKMMELTKEFVSEKCKSCEDSINALFPNVRFQLFEKNKTDDTVRECCNLTFNGHKYADLSTSTKLIASLEVVEAFQKVYNIIAPIVIDNAESITGNIKTNEQMIIMRVKEELCTKCGSAQHSRRMQNGLWKCLDCGYEWKKKLEIKKG